MKREGGNESAMDTGKRRRRGATEDILGAGALVGLVLDGLGVVVVVLDLILGNHLVDAGAAEDVMAGGDDSSLLVFRDGGHADGAVVAVELSVLALTNRRKKAVSIS